jgi:hypothetical protein
MPSSVGVVANAARRLDAGRRAVQQADGALAIAAGAAFAAIGVEEAHPEIGQRRPVEHDQLIAADAAMAIGMAEASAAVIGGRAARARPARQNRCPDHAS